MTWTAVCPSTRDPSPVIRRESPIRTATSLPVPTGVMPTPQDSVEEFKVNATNQTADFNNSAGAQVEVVTKRGTSRWHGTAYEYYLDNNFSANTWENNDPDPSQYQAPPDYHYSKFGGGAGGPILPHFMGRQDLFVRPIPRIPLPEFEVVPAPGAIAGSAKRQNHYERARSMI